MKIAYLYSTCVWLEVKGWILSCDTALDGTTLQANILLFQV
jgi:hypothetical protein